jgi:hypothetical protein
VIVSQEVVQRSKQESAKLTSFLVGLCEKARPEREGEELLNQVLRLLFALPLAQQVLE